MVVVVGVMVAEEGAALRIDRALTHVRMHRTAAAEVLPNETMMHAPLAQLCMRAMTTTKHLDSSSKYAQPSRGNTSNTSRSSNRTTSLRKAIVGIAVSHSLATLATVLRSKTSTAVMADGL